MKHIFKQSFKDLLNNRRIMAALVVAILLTIGISTYVALTIEASDLRVITHYTAYGVTHFYRDSWTYLLSFIGAAFVTTIFSIGISVKLISQDREPLALLFSCLSIAILCFILLTYLHVAEVA